MIIYILSIQCSEPGKIACDRKKNGTVVDSRGLERKETGKEHEKTFQSGNNSLYSYKGIGYRDE